MSEQSEVEFANAPPGAKEWAIKKLKERDARAVEQVARAIYEAADDKHLTGWPWDRSIYGGKQYWLKLARAALATTPARNTSQIGEG